MKAIYYSVVENCSNAEVKSGGKKSLVYIKVWGYKVERPDFMEKRTLLSFRNEQNSIPKHVSQKEL